MKRRNFLKTSGLALAGATLAKAATADRPNILFIFTDQQTYRAMS